MSDSTTVTGGDPAPPAPDPAAAAAALAKAKAEADKAAADARAAVAAAEKAEREEREAASEAAVRQRAAEASKATAVADKDAAAARQAQIAALVPDFSKIDKGSLDVKGDQALFGSVLAGRALDTAATTAAKGLELAAGSRVLVTSDADLATSDAVYANVKSALVELKQYAHKLLEETDPTKAQPQSFLAAAAAVAAALPAVLSLFSAKRTVSTGQVTVTDLAAAAALMGRLGQDVSIAYDDFRLVPDGAVKTAFEALGNCRRELAARKLVLASAHASLVAEQSEISDRIATLTKGVADGTADRETVLAALEAERSDLRDKRAEVDVATIKVEAVGAALTSVETFIATVTAVPEGAKRSPLADASLYEQLHEGNEFTHVLLVKSQNASTQQVIEDRPLWSKDKFTIVATASITYLLLRVTDNRIVHAGDANATVHGRGDIGSTLDLTVVV